MIKKSQSKLIGYRPSEEMKNIFEKFCSGPASISQPQLIEVAMQFLKSQGEQRMKKIIMGFLLNEDGWAEIEEENEKREMRKSA